MQISGRPLLETSIDQPSYLERVVDMRVRNAIIHGLNALILGSAGSGKTSLLRHFHFEAMTADVPSVYIDGRSNKSVAELLDTVRVGLGVPALKPPMYAAISIIGESYIPDPERAIAHLREKIPSGRRPLVFLDCPDGSVARSLFGSLRDEIWQVPISWIVAADAAAEADFRRPPTDAFFDVVERLEEMTANDVIRLLELREVPDGDAWVIASSLIEMPVSKRMPRDVLNLARKVVIEGGDVESEIKPYSVLSERLSKVSGAAALLARELLDQSAVSASDPDLQRRMGWSRARLAQVFKELEATGLARSFQSSEGKAGRPKRMYEIVDQ